MVQELADGDAFGKRRRVAVQLEEPLGDELQDECSDEDLRHAPDAEAVVDRHRLARPDVGEPGRRADASGRQKGYDDGAWNARRYDTLELIVDQLHC